MKVFITWSGERSRAAAEVIRTWLPGVLQAVKPYFSPDDVAKGTRWFPEIAKELDASVIGLLCVTKDNLQAPWLLFEAGAIGKNLEKSKVCPLLLDVEPTDLTGPLAQFQGARLQKSEFKKVVKMINAELQEGALESEVLDSVFDMWWPKLESGIQKALQELGPVEDQLARTDRDILEEVLALSRATARESTRKNRGIHPGAIEELVMEYLRLVDSATISGAPPELRHTLRRLSAPIQHIAREHEGLRMRRSGRWRDMLEYLDEKSSALDIESLEDENEGDKSSQEP